MCSEPLRLLCMTEHILSPIQRPVRLGDLPNQKELRVQDGGLPAVARNDRVGLS